MSFLMRSLTWVMSCNATFRIAATRIERRQFGICVLFAAVARLVCRRARAGPVADAAVRARSSRATCARCTTAACNTWRPRRVKKGDWPAAG